MLKTPIIHPGCLFLPPLAKTDCEKEGQSNGGTVRGLAAWSGSPAAWSTEGRPGVKMRQLEPLVFTMHG